MTWPHFGLAILFKLAGIGHLERQKLLVPEPVSLMVDTMGTGKVSKERIKEIIRECFDLRPAAIIEYLDLLRPIYRQTSVYGHFGRTEPEFSWEQTNMADKMRALAGI